MFLENTIVLEATDDFLTKRVQGLPQNDAEKMVYTQEEFVSCLKTYRQLSASYVSAVEYFDELEIHPDYIGTVLCVFLVNIVNDLVVIGEHNYSISIQVEENVNIFLK